MKPPPVRNPEILWGPGFKVVPHSRGYGRGRFLTHIIYTFGVCCPHTGSQWSPWLIVGSINKICDSIDSMVFSHCFHQGWTADPNETCLTKAWAGWVLGSIVPEIFVAGHLTPPRTPFNRALLMELMGLCKALCLAGLAMISLTQTAQRDKKKHTDLFPWLTSPKVRKKNTRIWFHGWLHWNSPFSCDFQCNLPNVTQSTPPQKTTAALGFGWPDGTFPQQAFFYYLEDHFM